MPTETESDRTLTSLHTGNFAKALSTECIRTISNYFLQSLRYQPRKTIYAPCRTCETLHRKPTTDNFMVAYSSSRSVVRSLIVQRIFPIFALFARTYSLVECASAAATATVTIEHVSYRFLTWRLRSLCAHQLFAIKNILGWSANPHASQLHQVSIPSTTRRFYLCFTLASNT